MYVFVPVEYDSELKNRIRKLKSTYFSYNVFNKTLIFEKNMIGNLKYSINYVRY